MLEAYYTLFDLEHRRVAFACDVRTHLHIYIHIPPLTYLHTYTYINKQGPCAGGAWHGKRRPYGGFDWARMAPFLAILASMIGWQCWGVLFEVADFLFAEVR